MKQLSCFTLILLFFIVQTKAQDNKVYLKGGLNIANISITNDGSIDDANALASFHIGLMADFPIGKYFGIQPGMLVTGKGAKTQSGSTADPTYFKGTTNPIYIELPVNGVIKIPLEDKWNNFFLGAGPYVAIGIAGKNKTEGKVFGAAFSSKKNIEFSNDDPTTINYEEGAGIGIMKRFDYGLNGTAGFEVHNLLISANYGLGLAKINSGSNSSENDKNKHRVFSISLGISL